MGKNGAMRGEFYDWRNYVILPGVGETAGLWRVNSCEAIRYRDHLRVVAKGHRHLQT